MYLYELSGYVEDSNRWPKVLNPSNTQYWEAGSINLHNYVNATALSPIQC